MPYPELREEERDRSELIIMGRTYPRTPPTTAPISETVASLPTLDVWWRLPDEPRH
jgi:hypothetical protein